jgi:hypothetical protein
MEVSELHVIEAHKVEDCRVNVVNMSALVDRSQADFIGRSDDLSALHAAARHPESESPRIMVTSRTLLIEGCATKLTAPYDESVLQKTARFQIGQ